VRLLFLGRMIDYKGADILADALQRIADRDDWRLTVAGHGPALTPELTARFKLPQVESVRPGWLSEAEINALLDSHDVMLAPYRDASQSGVVAEAMAAGLPCVVTPVGGLAEQVGGAGGWVVVAPTADAFAAGLRNVLDDPAGLAAKSQGASDIARAAWTAPHWEWLDRDWR
jgi:glycosyltransferase involved in cell wall biosynthesis